MIPVVIPVYQVDISKLEKTLISLDKQTSFERVVPILVMDRPTPEEKEILISKTQIVIESRGEGITHALNTGFDYIRKNFQECIYAGRCDVGDLWHEKHLEIALDYLSQGFDIVSSGVRIEDEPELEMCKFPIVQGFLVENIDLLLCKENIFNHPTVVGKVECFNYDTRCDGYEDYELWLRLLDKGYKLGFHTTLSVIYETSIWPIKHKDKVIKVKRLGLLYYKKWYGKEAN